MGLAVCLLFMIQSAHASRAMTDAELSVVWLDSYCNYVSQIPHSC